MHDALLNRTLRLTVVGTIAIISTTALILCYRSLFELIAYDFPSAGVKLGWGALCATAALLLIRYRGDLIDD